MAVAIEIRYAPQPPTCCKSWPVGATDENVVVKIPDRCLTRADVTEHIVGVAVAIKIDHCSCGRSVWLESHSCNICSGGKDGAHSARGKLKNVAADPIVGDKQIVRTVNSQTGWNYWNLIVFRGDSASQPGWSKLINGGV